MAGTNVYAVGLFFINNHRLATNNASAATSWLDAPKMGHIRLQAPENAKTPATVTTIKVETNLLDAPISSSVIYLQTRVAVSSVVRIKALRIIMAM